MTETRDSARDEAVGRVGIGIVRQLEDAGLAVVFAEDAERTDDARLIAAAPELLEACKDALAIIEALLMPSDEIKVMKALRAAIAKAEKGETDG